jgi:hypothetical protein
MTLDEALQLLETKNVPKDLYVLNGALGGGECEGIEQTENIWTTYYSERGQKSNVREFDSESEAVAAWLVAINKDLLLFGKQALF